MIIDQKDIDLGSHTLRLRSDETGVTLDLFGGEERATVVIPVTTDDGNKVFEVLAGISTMGQNASAV